MSYFIRFLEKLAVIPLQSDNINHFDSFDSSGMTCFSTVVSDSLVIRLYCFVDFAYKINGHAFSQLKYVSMTVLAECFRCGAMITAAYCPLPPLGQCVSQLCASRYEDVVLSLLLGPSGPKTLPELLSECAARVFGQPG